MKKRSKRLLHVVVGLGAAMTGTATVVNCGGDDSSCQPGTSGCYAQIAYNGDAYAQISNDAGDEYMHIAFNPDADAPEASLDDATDETDAPLDAPADGDDGG